MNVAALAGLTGLGLGAGLLLVLDTLLRARNERLADRVAAQLGPASPGPRRRGGSIPWFGTSQQKLQALLTAAGRSTDAAHHRSVTLGWVVAAAVGLIGLFVILSSVRPIRPLPALVAVITGIVAMMWWREASLRRAARRRAERKSAQFPQLAELLALSVAAGDALGPALARAGELLPGPLGDDVRTALARIDAGVPVSRSLEDLAEEAAVPALRDAIDSVLVAGERGTPLASVLRDQATDAREAARRDLMEAAGRIEIKMMVPVVFGLLPLSVLFAIYPSLALLSFDV